MNHSLRLMKMWPFSSRNRIPCEMNATIAHFHRKLKRKNSTYKLWVHNSTHRIASHHISHQSFPASPHANSNHFFCSFQRSTSINLNCSTFMKQIKPMYINKIKWLISCWFGNQCCGWFSVFNWSTFCIFLSLAFYYLFCHQHICAFFQFFLRMASVGAQQNMTLLICIWKFCASMNGSTNTKTSLLCGNPGAAAWPLHIYQHQLHDGEKKQLTIHYTGNQRKYDYHFIEKQTICVNTKWKWTWKIITIKIVAIKCLLKTFVRFPQAELVLCVEKCQKLLSLFMNASSAVYLLRWAWFGMAWHGMSWQNVVWSAAFSSDLLCSLLKCRALLPQLLQHLFSIFFISNQFTSTNN